MTQACPAEKVAGWAVADGVAVGVWVVALELPKKCQKKKKNCSICFTTTSYITPVSKPPVWYGGAGGNAVWLVLQ